jgi:hypothetical protein
LLQIITGSCKLDLLIVCLRGCVRIDLIAMNHWSFYNHAAALIPFDLRDCSGQVAVYYGVNDDPVKVGFDFLAGLNFDINLCRGYPVIHARIENYEGSGYRTMCGWLQIVTSVCLDSHDLDKAQKQTYVSVDVSPAFQASGLPFASFGILPQLFDAPCHNLGAYAQVYWTADSFLTTIPLRSRDEEITWLAGFRWGYMENDLPNQKPILLPLEVTGAAAWNQHLPYLSKECSGWKFRSAQE